MDYTLVKANKANFCLFLTGFNIHSFFYIRVEPRQFLFSGQFQPGNVLTDVLNFW